MVTTRVSLKDEVLRETSQTNQQTLLHNNAYARGGEWTKLRGRAEEMKGWSKGAESAVRLR